MSVGTVWVGLRLAAAALAILLLFLIPGPVSPGHAIYAVILFVGFRGSDAALARRSRGGWIALVILTGAVMRGWIAGDFSAGLETAVRGLLALGTLLLLAAHLPPAELARWMRDRGAPADLVGTMLLLLRYGDLLRQEAYRLERARGARSFSAAAETSWTAKSSLVGALFARAVARAERVYRAMLARGWQ
ncbi:MAG TPA: CbiQ family ECF transporter T component [Candidatus Ozemobacteraceae bacterium]|nr:CbiQ family ECF transporter T component [Candidatus Ozemobacteraceae bacterium]